MASEEIDVTPPELIEFSGRTEEWKAYEESLFEVFKKTIVEDKLRFQGLPVNPRRFPEEKGKHFTFWHLITEGEKEEDRTPDFQRCKRIGWVSWIIKNCENESIISYWESRRGSSKNWVIWYEKGQFAVVLAKRSQYFVLLSAYQVTDPRRIKSFERDREEYRQNRIKG